MSTTNNKVKIKGSDVTTTAGLGARAHDRESVYLLTQEGI